MEKNKHQIALFTFLKEDISSLLTSTVGLAQMINAEIEVLHITKPTAVSRKDNQLSAMRSINREHMLTDKRMKEIVLPIIDNYGIPITYSSTLGNIKNELVKYLNENNPDILVLGRGRSNPINTADDRIINFVLSVFKGPILIVSPDNGLEPGKKIGIGTLNCSEAAFAPSFTENLFLNANSTLRSFNIVETSYVLPLAEDILGRKTINYVFDHNENTVKNLPIYLSKNNIDLLFLERRKKKEKGLSEFLVTYDMVRKSDINLLITAEKYGHNTYNTTLKKT